jgi:hypothetical protein
MEEKLNIVDYIIFIEDKLGLKHAWNFWRERTYND